METRHLIVLLALLVICLFLIPIMIKPAMSIESFEDLPSDVKDQLKPINIKDFYNATAKPMKTTVPMTEERFNTAPASTTSTVSNTTSTTSNTASTPSTSAPTTPTTTTNTASNVVCPPGNVSKDQCVTLKDTMTKQEVLDAIGRLRRQYEAMKPDMSKYILKTQLPTCPAPQDLSKYVLKTEIPKCPTCPDMSKYIPKTELKCPPKDCVCPMCKDKTTYSTSVKDMSKGLEIDLGEKGADIVIEGGGKQYTIKPSKIVLERA